MEEHERSFSFQHSIFRSTWRFFLSSPLQVLYCHQIVCSKSIRATTTAVSLTRWTGVISKPEDSGPRGQSVQYDYLQAAEVHSQGRITQENFLSRTRLDRRDRALCVTCCHLAWVSKLLTGRGAVWKEARKIDFCFLAPSPYSYNPRRRPPRYIWKSRWPSLTVRRAISPRSHEKIGDCEQSSHVLYQTGLTTTIFRTWKCFCCGHYFSCSQHADQYVQRHHIS